jgi:Tfp pilus assembly protein PilF
MVPDKIERLLQRAQEAISEREWEKAKQVYLMALGLRSDMPDIHYGLATVFFQLRELTSAAHHFREVIRLDPLRAGAHVNLGAVLNLMASYDDAITALRRALQIDPQRVEAYYNLGLVHRRKGQIDLALASYKEAIRINPRMADAHLNLANLYLERQQPRLAAHHYEQALQVRPGWEKAAGGLAHARQAIENPSDHNVPATGAPAASMRPAATDTPVDPVVHATFLTGLHQATAVCAETTRLLQKIITDEVDAAIHELSNVLLHSGSRGELDACLNRFESAVQRLRTTR